MSLRQNWETEKSKAQKEYKESAPGSFPLQFKEDLSPTLDKWEKAKPGDERDKLAAKVYAVISNYVVMVDHAERQPKSPLGAKAATTLRTSLKNFKQSISDVQKHNEEEKHKEAREVTQMLNRLSGYAREFSKPVVAN